MPPEPGTIIAQGVIGRAAAAHFVAQPDITVYALSRRGEGPVEGVQPIALDLLDAAERSEISVGILRNPRSGPPARRFATSLSTRAVRPTAPISACSRRRLHRHRGDGHRFFQ